MCTNESILIFYPVCILSGFGIVWIVEEFALVILKNLNEISINMFYI